MIRNCDILTKEGYFNRFWEFNKTMSQQEAYIKVEGELAKRFNMFRYSSFQSFQTCLYRYIHHEFKQL